MQQRCSARNSCAWIKPQLCRQTNTDCQVFLFCADGAAVREYINATVPLMAFGEYWDTCEYTDGVLNYNQDAHRQRTVNWCDQTGGTAAAFDFTTKGTKHPRRYTVVGDCSFTTGVVASAHLGMRA